MNKMLSILVTVCLLLSLSVGAATTAYAGEERVPLKIIALPEFAVQYFRKNSQSPARNKIHPGIIWVTSVFQARDPILIGGESYDGQGEGAE